MAHHKHHCHADTTQNITTAFWLNLGFTVIEFAGGIVTNSVAILSDALHDLGDSLSLGLAWYFQKKSVRGPDKIFTYGYGRLSVVGALVNSLILVLGSGYMLSQAIPRLFHPEASHPEGMLLLAVLGIAANGAAVLKLKKGKTLNERAVMLHLMEDVLGWVAVLFGSILIYFFHWTIIDPLLSLGITCYILFNVFRNLKTVMRVILQATPEGIDTQEIETKIGEYPEIEHVSDLQLWTIDGNEHILSLHLMLSAKADAEKVKAQVRQLLEHWHICHSTIEVSKKLLPNQPSHTQK